MTSEAPSRNSIIFTWLVIALCAVLLASGMILHGFSLEIQKRFWSDMFARVGGPMTFRVILQPIMAMMAALHDGIKDAREGHKSFFWMAWFDRTQPTGRLREGLISVARVSLLAVCIDVIYQLRELSTFYPAEAVIVAMLLAVVPYFVFRWIVEIVARRWFARKGITSND